MNTQKVILQSEHNRELYILRNLEINYFKVLFYLQELSISIVTLSLPKYSRD